MSSSQSNVGHIPGCSVDWGREHEGRDAAPPKLSGEVELEVVEGDVAMFTCDPKDAKASITWLKVIYSCHG